jgi:geranylgeranyl diphosphate synthase type 3
LIHSIRSTPGDHQVINILRQRTEDVDLKKHCVECLKKTGSLAYTEKVLDGIVAEARGEIDRLGGNPILSKIIDALTAVHTVEE